MASRHYSKRRSNDADPILLKQVLSIVRDVQ